MRRRDFNLLSLFLLGIGLANCTNTAQPDPKPSVSKDSRFRIWWNEGYFPEETEVIRQLVAAWEKQSGMKAELTIYSEKDLARETNNAIDSGNLPDVLYSYSADFTLFPQLAWNGLLADVSDVVQPIKDIYSPSALQAVSYQNNVAKKRSYYAVPISQSTTHIHYWQDMLANAGLDKSAIPQQWDAFWKFWLQPQETLQQKGQKEVYGIGLPMSPAATDTFFQFEQFLEAYNVELLTEEGQLALDVPAVRQGVIAALKQYTDLYKIKEVPPQAVDWADPDNNVAFLSRTCVMTATPSLSIPASHRQDTETYTTQTVTIPWPSKPDGQPLRYLVAVKQAVIFEGSAHKNTAKSFLSYMVQPQNLVAYIKGSQGRFFPVMPKLLQDPFWTDPKDPHISTAVQQFKQTRPFYSVLNPAYTQVQSKNVWGNVIKSVAQGTRSPEQGADDALAQIKQIFAEWK